MASRTAAIAASLSTSPGAVTIPGMDPCVRRWRARARVSIPAIAGTQLTGAGSTFDYPFFSKAFYTYSQKHPDVTVNYQSIGSGGGIQVAIVVKVTGGQIAAIARRDREGTRASDSAVLL